MQQNVQQSFQLPQTRTSSQIQKTPAKVQDRDKKLFQQKIPEEMHRITKGQIASQQLQLNQNQNQASISFGGAMDPDSINQQEYEVSTELQSQEGDPKHLIQQENNELQYQQRLPQQYTTDSEKKEFGEQPFYLQQKPANSFDFGKNSLGEGSLKNLHNQESIQLQPKKQKQIPAQALNIHTHSKRPSQELSQEMVQENNQIQKKSKTQAQVYLSNMPKQAQSLQPQSKQVEETQAIEIDLGDISLDCICPPNIDDYSQSNNQVHSGKQSYQQQQELDLQPYKRQKVDSDITLINSKYKSSSQELNLETQSKIENISGDGLKQFQNSIQIEIEGQHVKDAQKTQVAQKEIQAQDNNQQHNQFDNKGFITNSHFNQDKLNVKVNAKYQRSTFCPNTFQIGYGELAQEQEDFVFDSGVIDDQEVQPSPIYQTQDNPTLSSPPKFQEQQAGIWDRSRVRNLEYQEYNEYALPPVPQIKGAQAKFREMYNPFDHPKVKQSSENQFRDKFPTDAQQYHNRDGTKKSQSQAQNTQQQTQQQRQPQRESIEKLVEEANKLYNQEQAELPPHIIIKQLNQIQDKIKNQYGNDDKVSQQKQIHEQNKRLQEMQKLEQQKLEQFMQYEKLQKHKQKESQNVDQKMPQILLKAQTNIESTKKESVQNDDQVQQQQQQQQGINLESFEEMLQQKQNQIKNKVTKVQQSIHKQEVQDGVDLDLLKNPSRIQDKQFSNVGKSTSKDLEILNQNNEAKQQGSKENETLLQRKRLLKKNLSNQANNPRNQVSREGQIVMEKQNIMQQDTKQQQQVFSDKAENTDTLVDYNKEDNRRIQDLQKQNTESKQLDIIQKMAEEMRLGYQQMEQEKLKQSQGVTNKKQLIKPPKPIQGNSNLQIQNKPKIKKVRMDQKMVREMQLVRLSIKDKLEVIKQKEDKVQDLQKEIEAKMQEGRETNQMELEGRQIKKTLRNDQDDKLNDWKCDFCDDGGPLIMCDGPCRRSFHFGYRGHQSVVDILKGDKSESNSDKEIMEEGSEEEVDIDEDIEKVMQIKKDIVLTDCNQLEIPLDLYQWQTGNKEDKIMCPNCLFGKQHCFICKEIGNTRYESDQSKDQIPKVYQCCFDYCGKFFHLDCLQKDHHYSGKWNSFMYKQNGESLTVKEQRTQDQLKVILTKLQDLENKQRVQKFICPRHFCKGCNTYLAKRKKDVYICTRCPTTWHKSCMPNIIKKKQHLIWHRELDEEGQGAYCHTHKFDFDRYCAEHEPENRLFRPNYIREWKTHYAKKYIWLDSSRKWLNIIDDQQPKQQNNQLQSIQDRPQSKQFTKEEQENLRQKYLKEQTLKHERQLQLMNKDLQRQKDELSTLKEKELKLKAQQDAFVKAKELKASKKDSQKMDQQVLGTKEQANVVKYQGIQNLGSGRASNQQQSNIIPRKRIVRKFQNPKRDSKNIQTVHKSTKISQPQTQDQPNTGPTKNLPIKQTNLDLSPPSYQDDKSGKAVLNSKQQSTQPTKQINPQNTKVQVKDQNQQKSYALQNKTGEDQQLHPKQVIQNKQGFAVRNPVVPQLSGQVLLDQKSQSFHQDDLKNDQTDQKKQIQQEAGKVTKPQPKEQDRQNPAAIFQRPQHQIEKQQDFAQASEQQKKLQERHAQRADDTLLEKLVPIKQKPPTQQQQQPKARQTHIQPTPNPSKPSAVGLQLPETKKQESQLISLGKRGNSVNKDQNVQVPSKKPDQQLFALGEKNMYSFGQPASFGQPQTQQPKYGSLQQLGANKAIKKPIIKDYEYKQIIQQDDNRRGNNNQSNAPFQVFRTQLNGSAQLSNLDVRQNLDTVDAAQLLNRDKNQVGQQSVYEMIKQRFKDKISLQKDLHTLEKIDKQLKG